VTISFPPLLWGRGQGGLMKRVANVDPILLRWFSSSSRRRRESSKPRATPWVNETPRSIPSLKGWDTECKPRCDRGVN
jgi:hypothetical protein